MALSFFNSICVTDDGGEYTIEILNDMGLEESKDICITDLITGDKVIVGVEVVDNIIASLQTMKDIIIWNNTPHKTQQGIALHEMPAEAAKDVE